VAGAVAAGAGTLHSLPVALQADWKRLDRARIKLDALRMQLNPLQIKLNQLRIKPDPRGASCIRCRSSCIPSGCS